MRQSEDGVEEFDNEGARSEEGLEIVSVRCDSGPTTTASDQESSLDTTQNTSMDNMQISQIASEGETMENAFRNSQV